MIIDKINIKQFRGFLDVEFQLGEQITVIAGQNGTQKTTLLGIITQPFTITDTENPMYSEKPLCGGNFKSSFSDKFKLSPDFDKAKSHEWSLFLNNVEEPFVVESILRDKESETIRFWQKGDRSKGAGYIQMPVIFLSLKRLLPIGEDNKISQSSSIVLNQAEQDFYKTLHKEILISLDTIHEASYLESRNKNTLGVNTDHYDWRQNSAGQDNVSKIILALLSFKRLQENHPESYKGGLLAIDEIDATMYPASQTKLLEVLRKYASKFKLQIIFTTHSLSLLEKTCNLQSELTKKEATKNQVKVVFLEKRNNKVCIINEASYSTIQNRLNVAISNVKTTKIDVFTEDKEAAFIAKVLLGRFTSRLKFIDVTMPCSSLIDLSYRKIPCFSFPSSIIILDGDVRQNVTEFKKIRYAHNVILLPGDLSPERLLAQFLCNLNDDDPLWTQINPDFNKQYCFRDYTLDYINGDRKKAKEWFMSIRNNLGDTLFKKIINRWKTDNNADCSLFLTDFRQKYNKFAQELSIEKL